METIEDLAEQIQRLLGERKFLQEEIAKHTRDLRLIDDAREKAYAEYVQHQRAAVEMQDVRNRAIHEREVAEQATQITVEREARFVEEVKDLSTRYTHELAELIARAGGHTP